MSCTIRLWLDDVRPAPNGWTHVKTPEQAITLLKTGDVSELSLDHDLGLTDRQTGYTVVAWMEEAAVTGRFEPPAKISIHSANPVGRKRMEAGIRNIKRP